MKTIDQIDRNMAVVTRIEDPDVVWHDVHDAPFSLHGFCMDQKKGESFRRLPKDVAASVSEGVLKLSPHTAGGRVRFKTNSPYVALHVELGELQPMDHMALTGIYGFDLYIRVNGEYFYRGTFRPSVKRERVYEGRVLLPEGTQEVTVHFPLYNGVDKLFVGVKEGSEIAAPTPYTHEKPVVYYGSSITQGGCASRPGNAYPAMISRMLDCDHINMGFSGRCKAEDAMEKFIETLPMSVFVYDYDHNAPTPEYLRETHEKFFLALRKARPDLPVIFVTCPDYYLHESVRAECYEIIWNTYQNALAAGDKNVAFVDGRAIFEGFFKHDCTVDGCHPNDLGFMFMAQKIGKEVEKWL